MSDMSLAGWTEAEEEKTVFRIELLHYLVELRFYEKASTQRPHWDMTVELSGDEEVSFTWATKDRSPAVAFAKAKDMMAQFIFLAKDELQNAIG